MIPVSLTFDDGPSTWTEAILDLLAAHDAHATFFVVGGSADRRRDTLVRIAAEGHEVGNHTWSHPSLARECDDGRVRDELERTNELVADVLGAPPTLYRAPHYDVDERVDAIASRLGLTHVRGDVAPPDWHDRWTAGLTVTFVLRQIRPNGIIGLHDGVPPAEAGARSRQATVDAVAAILPGLEERGLTSVPASRLLARTESI